MHRLSFGALSVISLLWGLVITLPNAVKEVNAINSSSIKVTFFTEQHSVPSDLIHCATQVARGTEACADTSSTVVIYQSYNAGSTAHLLNYRFAFENYNSQLQALIWADLHPMFRAWTTQQNSTVPLFQLATADRSQYIYRVGADARTPPVVSGFSTDVFIVGWVYDSQMCGGVPLTGVTLERVTDSYFTTSAFEHDSLVNGGWTDNGIIAFVVPLSNV